MREMEDLARVVKDHTNESINGAISGIGVEFATMTDTGLKLDNFKYEINDYKVLDYLRMDKDYFTQTNSAGEDNHSHKVATPDALRPLKAGDRVIVAQIGSELIIMGRVS